jgi:competence protein ComEA
MTLKTLFVTGLMSLSLTTVAFAEETNQTVQSPPDAPNATQTMETDNTTQTESKININTATTKDLRNISGITANKARAIIKYRKQHGPFKSVEDIKLVKGFKRLPDEQLKVMEDQMSIE